MGLRPPIIPKPPARVLPPTPPVDMTVSEYFARILTRGEPQAEPQAVEWLRGQFDKGYKPAPGPWAQAELTSS